MSLRSSHKITGSRAGNISAEARPPVLVKQLGNLPGKDKAIIAIIDSGFDLQHPNLHYVDRSMHFNAAQYLERQRKARFGILVNSSSSYDASRSIRAHGTSVAGAAAAFRRSSRDPLIVGVAAGFPVMPLKASPRPNPEEVAAAINWAVEHGARVINMSFKIAGTRIVRKAIERAWDNDLVLCAAAGNRNQEFRTSRVDFPARHPNVIAVGAVDRQNRRKQLDPRNGRDWGSQYGRELDVVAPGTAVQTLDDRGELGALPGNYLLLSKGTSIASPQVAGLAALLFGLQPERTNQEVRDAIERSCEKVRGYLFKRVPGRRWSWNKEVGYGVVSVENTVRDIIHFH